VLRFRLGLPCWSRRQVQPASLTDEQVSLLLTGDCWQLRDDCVCRSIERFAMHKLGVVDVHGHFTPGGYASRAALIAD
jgi:hypothetical protein